MMSDARLQEVALARNGRMLSLPSRSAGSARLKPGRRIVFKGLADDAMSLARSLEPAGGIASDLGVDIAQSLIAGYVDALTDSDQAIAHRPLGSAATSAEERHHHLILACERLALSGEHADVALAEIARRGGYSMRSLKSIFRRSAGMTPGRRFIIARLNGALRDLKSADRDCTVANVATKWW